MRERTKIVRKRTKIYRLRDKMPERKTQAGRLRGNMSESEAIFRKGTIIRIGIWVINIHESS